MGRRRHQYNPLIKAKVAFEAICEKKAIHLFAS